MKRLKFFPISLLLALTVGAASAEPSKRTGKDVPLYSASANFKALGNSQYDAAFNEKTFIELVRTALERAGISVDGNTRGTYHLQFDVDYAYHIGDVEYRFMAIRISARNKDKHALCDVSQSVWWGGPSGPTALRNAFDSATNEFFKSCIR